MTLRYLTLLKYPSRYVNRMQVMKMSEAFRALCDFKLYVEAILDTKENVFDEYGVTADVNIGEVGGKARFLWPQSFWMALKYRSIIKREPPGAIFYVRDVLLAFFLCVFCGKFRRRFFFEIHSLGKFPRFIYGFVFSRASGIISTNIKKKEAIESLWHIPARKIIVAPNGVDIRLFTGLPLRSLAREKLKLPRERAIIMYVGSTQFWKGVERIQECARAMPDLLFVIVGGAIESHDNFLAIPRVKPREVPMYLRAADLLLAPYPSHFEVSRLWTSPVKLLEYMASGTPFLVSDMPSTRELVSEEFAYVYNPDQNGALCDGVRWALDHMNEMENRAKRGEVKAKEYSWERRAKTILNFISNVQ